MNTNEKVAIKTILSKFAREKANEQVLIEANSL
jgi:hypothetical protein